MRGRNSNSLTSLSSRTWPREDANFRACSALLSTGPYSPNLFTQNPTRTTTPSRSRPLVLFLTPPKSVVFPRPTKLTQTDLPLPNRSSLAWAYWIRRLIAGSTSELLSLVRSDSLVWLRRVELIDVLLFGFQRPQEICSERHEV